MGGQIWETIHIKSTPYIGHNRAHAQDTAPHFGANVYETYLGKKWHVLLCGAQCGAILPVIQLSFLIRTIYLGRKRPWNRQIPTHRKRSPRKIYPAAYGQVNFGVVLFMIFTALAISNASFIILFNFICFRQLLSPLLSNIPARHLVTTNADPRLRRGSFPEAD